jgi:hypothetical protein
VVDVSFRLHVVRAVDGQRRLHYLWWTMADSEEGAINKFCGEHAAFDRSHWLYWQREYGAVVACVHITERDATSGAG